MEPRQPGDFRNGIARPILRSFALVIGLFVAVGGICFLLQSGELFFPLLFGGVVLLWIFDRKIRPNKTQEDEARRRWLGLSDDR